MKSFDFRIKTIDKTRNYLLEEIKHNGLMSKKYKKFRRNLNYFKYFLVFVSAVTGCVSISAFSSLVGIPVDIMSSVVELKICSFTAGIKKYRSIIKEKRKKHGKVVFLGKVKLDTIDVLISKALIDSCISHDEFVLLNNALRKYNERKNKSKRLWNILYENNGNLLRQL